MSRISLMDYLDLCILHGRDGEVLLCFLTDDDGGSERGDFHVIRIVFIRFMYIFEFTNLDITISNLFTVLI